MDLPSGRRYWERIRKGTEMVGVACIPQRLRRGSYCCPDFVLAARCVALTALDFGMV